MKIFVPKIILSILFLGLFFSCKNNEEQEQAKSSEGENLRAIDPHTQSNADKVNVKHLTLDIKVDFDKRKISGSAAWTINNNEHEKFLKLDTYDLTIDSVLVDGNLVSFELDSFVTHLGSALKIPIKENTHSVKIYYASGPKARALQWLTPEQTLGKTSPFLYTQSESIYARSWIPCPDGPGIRFTYTARVAVPDSLLALMSAENPQEKNDSGIYHFRMNMAIPAYLMALAVGDIHFKPIGENTGVYAEAPLLQEAAHEFSDIDSMIATAERLYGDYRWGRYDILVLPPGFPIGGMENPKLTFATPTIIAGDKSLTNLIAHELAHSWSGNLVTNATWSDFWLNEGFTVYFERRITEAMSDKTYADMLWELGYQDLQAAVDDLGKDSEDTHLKLNLAGRDPDEGLTDIAYEKGALFLKLLENTVGRKKMDVFLNNYFSDHAFKTIHTAQFVNYMKNNLLNNDTALIKKLKIKEWIYGPGIPDNAPRAAMERFEKVNEMRTAFLEGKPASELNTQNWTTQEWLHFLRKMPQPLALDKMSSLDKAYDFTNAKNSEIAFQWFMMSIAADYKKVNDNLEVFLSKVGRRKFIEPLYEEMIKNGKAQQAKNLYKKYRKNYHPLAQMTLDKIVGK